MFLAICPMKTLRSQIDSSILKDRKSIFCGKKGKRPKTKKNEALRAEASPVPASPTNRQASQPRGGNAPAPARQINHHLANRPTSQTHSKFISHDNEKKIKALVAEALQPSAI